MSAPLKEIRIYVPESAHIFLAARAKAFDDEISAIAKRVVMEWVKREAHAHRMAARLFRSTGIEPDLFGEDPEEPGSSSEDVGSARIEPDRAGIGRNAPGRGGRR